MDFSSILAEKDAEILSLRAEIAELKSKLEGKDLEEIVFDTEVADDEEPMQLKLPEEDEEQNPNVFQDPNAFMQFMQLMMMNNNNTVQNDDEEMPELDDDEEMPELDDDEEMPELEDVHDIIPESD